MYMYVYRAGYEVWCMWYGMGNVCGSVCWFYMRNCIQSERDLLTKLDTTWNEQDMKRSPPQLKYNTKL